MKQIILIIFLLASMTATAQKALKGDIPNNAYIVTNEVALQELHSLTGTITSAWQNKPDSTNWTWISDGMQITLTGYNFASMDVFIPDTLNGLPVTGFGSIFSPRENGSAITSVSGGNNIKSIGSGAFSYCINLASIALVNATTVADYAFDNCRSLSVVTLPRVLEFPFPSTFQRCTSLTSMSLPQATSIGDGMFSNCTNLTSVSLPQAISIGNSVFANCTSLTSVYWGQNQPPEPPAGIYNYIIENQVTNYVTNPAATWGSTFCGMPVMRLPVTASAYTLNGSTITSWPSGGTTESQVTNIVQELQELHRDSYTNVVWRSVYSNGWQWLVAYTNYPAN